MFALSRTLDVQTAGKMMKGAAEATLRLVGGLPGDHGGPSDELGGEDMQLLQDVLAHPVSKITERYARLGLSAKKGTRLVSRLVDRELVKAETIPVPGSHVRLLDLTGEGRKLLGVPANTTDRHGGLEHRYWIENIFQQLKDAGIQVAKEAPIGGGKTVDLVVNKDGKRVAIEVETGKSDWKANVRKCMEAGIGRIVVGATRAHLIPATTVGIVGGSACVVGAWSVAGKVKDERW